MDTQMLRWTKRQMDKNIHGQNEQMNGLMNIWMDRHTDSWNNRHMDGWAVRQTCEQTWRPQWIYEQTYRHINRHMYADIDGCAD